MDELFGLPAHPLVVHGAVVLVPLAAVGVVLCAFWPAARAKLGVAVVAIALAGAVMAFLAAESGEALEENVVETELVEEHAELGDSGLASATAVLVGALGVVGFGMYERRRRGDSTDDTSVTTDEGPAASSGSTNLARIRVGVGVVAVVLAVLGTVQIARIGHSGAKATWDSVEVDGTDIDDDD